MPHKLLLADDSVTIQRVIELTFADEDVQVIAVGDGMQAIERIEAERPDIVLADVGMPERDGYDVAAFVKRTPHLAHIPVLLLTGAFEPVDEQRASEVGCDGVLAKPFEPHMVITRVKELLAGSGGGAGRPALGQADERVSGDDGGAPRLAASLAGPVPEVEAGVEAEVEAAQERIEDPLAAAKLRLSRRTPIAVPGFGAPVQPAESTAALDEYFDRLDAAFSTLQGGPAGQPQGEARVAPADAGAPSAAPAPEAVTTAAAPAGAGRAAAEPPEPGVQEGTAVTPAAPAGPAPVSSIAQAFSALLASERGDAPEGGVPVFIGPGALPPAVMDDLAERVTRQVLERMSDRLVRDTVTDVVSRVAERLVREEIERVKATLT